MLSFQDFLKTYFLYGSVFGGINSIFRLEAYAFVGRYFLSVSL